MEILAIVIAVIGVLGTFVGVYYTRKSVVPLPNPIRELGASDAKTQSILNCILSRGSISVGVVHYPPLLDFDEKGKVSGLYAVIMKLVAKKNNLKVIYQPLKWNELCLSIESNHQPRPEDVV